MSINHAILGILSYKPFTGYDLKKIIQDSPFMYWSGNNNQIYKSLVELLEDGLVTSEVCHQESSPSKKIYTITGEGIAELKEWTGSSAELPDLKKHFLVQLAWADQLSGEELNALISDYENQVRLQVIMQKEKHRRGTFSPSRTPREIYLWDMIHENIIASYESELAWIERLRKGIANGNKEEPVKMNYNLVQKDNKKYINIISAKEPISAEQGATDLISLCFENDTHFIMLHKNVLSEDFFKLRTGLAGTILQKLVNYRVRAVLVIPEDYKLTGRFKELAAELNKGNDFRVFYGIPEAENWLLS